MSIIRKQAALTQESSETAGITVAAVTKSYAGKQILGPINLTIEPGGVTALIGPNGAGKSTLLNTIGRLLQYDAGNIHVDGRDVRSARVHDLAKVLSILKQDNHFTARLSVQQLVTLGRFPHSRGRITDHDVAVIQSAIEFVGLTGSEGKFLDELSGGQRQRAYVAMVLAQDTQYVLLDEPLTGLDMRHAVELMTQIRAAVDSLKKTLVLVIHDVNFAAAYADRIVALKNGTLVASGTPEQVFTSTVLEAVFDTPVTVHSHEGTRFALYHRPSHACDYVQGEAV